MKKLSSLVGHLRSYITLCLLLLLSIALFYFSNGLNIKSLLSKASLTNPAGNPKAVEPSQFHGWIAWWDEDNALNSLKRSSQKLSSISPVWYKIDERGKLQEIPHKAEGQIKSLAVQANIKLVPAIANDFDPKRVALIVNNSDASRVLMEELADLATTSGYHGYDIDWEEINPKDQELFTIFIQRLSEFLHTYNLIITVSVHPQTGQSSDREVARGYNLAKLSKSADVLKIMAYDFHNKDSLPGAITPFSELKKVLDYVSSIIPPGKIILGLPTYGYDWAESSGKAAEAVSFAGASARVKQNGGQILRDEESNSLVGSYNLGGQKHTIWFEDAQTIDKMIEQSRSVGIYQFSFWRLGTEDPGFWAKIPVRY